MKISTSEKIDSLNGEIKRRPTFMQAITIAGICISTVVALFTFITGHMLNTQASNISVKTKLVVSEAMDKYAEAEDVKWVNRKKTIVDEVLAFLGLK